MLQNVRCVKYLVLLIILFVVILIPSCEKSPPFGKIYSPHEYETCIHLIPLSADRYMFVGTRFSPDTYEHGSLFKLMDSDFGVIWEYSNLVTDVELGVRAFEVERGFLLICTTGKLDSNERGARVVLLSEKGEEIWNIILGDRGLNRVWDGVETADGGFLMAGSTSQSTLPRSDGWLVKLDSSGNVTWTRSYGNKTADSFNSISVHPTDGYILTGQTKQATFNAWTLKVDVRGDTIWSKTFEDVSSLSNNKSLTMNGLIFAGKTHKDVFGASMGLLLKTDLNGNEIWSQFYKGLYGISALVPYRGGGYLLLGTTRKRKNEERNIWLARVNDSGEVIWTKTMGGEQHDQALDIVQTSGGYKIINLTRSFGVNGYDFWIVDLDDHGVPIE
jgi:hypothetical protein